MSSSTNAVIGQCVGRKIPFGSLGPLLADPAFADEFGGLAGNNSRAAVSKAHMPNAKISMAVCNVA